MAIKCGACGAVIPGSGILRKCPSCKTGDITKFSRVDDIIDPAKHARDRAFLEGRRER